MKPLKNARRTVMAGAIASAISGVAMISAPAQAMNIAQDGLGEVLIFPYYTVRGGFDTLLSVTNTSDKTVLFKVRWREAKNSREVRDFNVALSPRDVWTAGVTISGTEGALVRTFDNSCTSPPLPAGAIAGSREVAFTSIGYDGSDALFPYDNGGRGLGRSQEGYFEIFEMAISSVPESAITSANPIEFATQHVNGTPRNCAAFNEAFINPANLVNGPTGSGVFSSFIVPRNVLMGGAALINVETGKAYDAAPTAIQNFQEASTMIFAPGDTLPSLAEGTNSPAQMLINVDGVSTLASIAVAPTNVTASVEVVSALLHAENLMNEFAAGGTETSGAKTSWVVTFPTKHHYTDELGSLTTVQPPFAQLFTPTGQSCDSISVGLADREEAAERVLNDTQFSPAPSGPGGVSLCNEVNVLTFTPSATPAPVLDTTVGLGVNTSNVGSSGWARVSLNGTGPWLAVPQFVGLPAIGFNLIGRDNTVDAGNNRNYASGSPHARTVLSVPATPQ